MTQLTDTTSLHSAVAQLLQASWNCTTASGSIAKTIIALHYHRLYCETIEDAKRLERTSDLSYISNFLSKVNQVQCLIDVDSNAGIILQEVINTIENKHPCLVHNYRKLAEANLVEHLLDFDTTFRGKIQRIYSLEKIHIIATDKHTSAFYSIVDGRFQGRSWETLDQAIVGAIAIRYDGINSQAGQFFCKMIGLSPTLE
ncbi:hypothetical protein [Leptolyngbya sp. AN10]|uniref:hypothetical protein n=1 Tax=Leptolyngbya sp. AN10 TaxID=3423365 RepID=UPI003D319CEF